MSPKNLAWLGALGFTLLLIPISSLYMSQPHLGWGWGSGGICQVWEKQESEWRAAFNSSVAKCQHTTIWKQEGGSGVPPLPYHHRHRCFGMAPAMGIMGTGTKPPPHHGALGLDVTGLL